MRTIFILSSSSHISPTIRYTKIFEGKFRNNTLYLYFKPKVTKYLTPKSSSAEWGIYKSQNPIHSSLLIVQSLLLLLSELPLSSNSSSSSAPPRALMIPHFFKDSQLFCVAQFMTLHKFETPSCPSKISDATSLLWDVTFTHTNSVSEVCYPFLYLCF